MTKPGPKALLALAAVVGMWAAIVALTGEIDLRPAGIPLRSRTWQRTAILAAVLTILALAGLRRQLPGVLAATVNWLPWIAAAWAAGAGLVFGTHAAGGADSYGYVSQAGLFAKGRLVQDLIDIRAFSWPDAKATLTPLAYTSGASADTVAPIYPPGLPMLMAPFAALDPRGVFLVVPLCAGAAVGCCWLLGRAMDGRLTGALAAVLLSVSPVFLFQSVQPMSDVPAAAAWLAALALARIPRHSTAMLSGLSASLAILIRPNLAPLSLIVAAVVHASARNGRWRRVLGWALALAPGVAALLLIQQVRYGSPIASGYGSFDELFRLSNVRFNLARYPRWLTETHTWFIWLWVLAPLAIAARRRPQRILGWSAWGFSGAVLLAYLPYSYFQPHEWSYARFLLPAIPLMIVLALTAMASLLRRLAPRAARPLLVVLAAAVAVWWSVTAASLGVFSIRDEERKYPAVGGFVAARLPPHSVVFAMQHSGSIRHYADRPTVRWDVLDPAWLDRAIVELRAAGRVPFAALDPDEEAAFRARFGGAGQKTVRSMVPFAIVERTRIYELR